MWRSCSLPQSPLLLWSLWTPYDRKGHKWGRIIQFLLSFFLFFFSSTWPISPSRIQGLVSKWGTSVWGIPFFLRSLQLPFVFQQAGIMPSEGCVSVQTVLLIRVVHFAASHKTEEQNNLSSRSKNAPDLLQTDILSTKSQTSNLVQNCGLWKIWCDCLEEWLSWNQNSHLNPT